MEQEQRPYFPLLRLLLTRERYKKVTIKAKVLYGMMLDRMTLSEKRHHCVAIRTDVWYNIFRVLP